MTPPPYTSEQRAADARIAVAMGTHGYFISPAGLIYCIELPAHDALDVGYTRANDPTRIDVVGMKVPEFHASEDARRSLLEWLRADDERWERFIKAYFGHDYLTGALSSYILSDEEMVKEAFLATPEQVARAADAAIREGETGPLPLPEDMQ